MAAVRPLVLVYQELENISSVAETPTLETLIAGPCYHIQDYPDDSDDIEVDEYGSSDASSDTQTGSSSGRPEENTNAIILTDPPNNVVGAILDHDSVTVYLEEVLIEVASGTNGKFGADAPDENLFTDEDGENLADLGIEKGDRLVVTTEDGETYIRQIQSVGEDGDDTLRTTSNFTDEGNEENLSWRIEREIEELELDDQFVELEENEIRIAGGAYHMDDLNDDGSEDQYYINYARVFIEYRALRQDLSMVTEVDVNNLEDVLGIVDERNPLAAGAQVTLENTTTEIQVFGVEGDNLNGELDRVNAYSKMTTLLESRDDVYAMIPLTRDDGVVDALHDHAVKFSEPERAKFRTVIANNTELPETKTLEGPSTSGTTESNSSDPHAVFVHEDGGFEDDGVRGGDTLAIAQDDATGDVLGEYEIDKAYDNNRLYSPDINEEFSGDGLYYVLRGPDGVVDREVEDVEVTGADTITVGTGADEEDVGKVIRLTNANDNADTSPLGNADFLITDVDEATDEYTVVGPDLTAENGLEAEIVETVVSITEDDKITTRRPFRRVLNNNASFSSNGVVASDVLQVPIGGGSEYDEDEVDLYEATVESVVSENRIELVEGSDIPTDDPHEKQEENLDYRVIRSLDKAGQRDELLAVVDEQTGYNSKRLILIWPDECLLSNVQNNKTGSRSRQPGYYLACAVGGMNTGMPPHQGFTFIGISGVEEIYHSSRYFKEDDLEELSNAGWYLFLQDTASTQPYCLHQLTTDTSVLENMEFSLVRDFDYVARFYKDILDQFIGRYNVTPQTLDLLRETINNGTDQLKSDSLPRIGAPIIDATIDVLEPLEGQRDRVEIYMNVDLPAPLNRIGLHLVA